MCPKEARVQPNCSNPLANQSSVLSGRDWQVTSSTAAEQKLARLLIGEAEIGQRPRVRIAANRVGLRQVLRRGSNQPGEACFASRYSAPLRSGDPHPGHRVRTRLPAGGKRIRTAGPTSESTQPPHRPHVADRQHPSCLLIPLANSISISAASGTSGSNPLSSSRASARGHRPVATGPSVSMKLTK